MRIWICGILTHTCVHVYIYIYIYINYIYIYICIAGTRRCPRRPLRPPQKGGDWNQFVSGRRSLKNIFFNTCIWSPAPVAIQRRSPSPSTHHTKRVGWERGARTRPQAPMSIFSMAMFCLFDLYGGYLQWDIALFGARVLGISSFFFGDVFYQNFNQVFDHGLYRENHNEYNVHFYRALRKSRDENNKKFTKLRVSIFYPRCSYHMSPPYMGFLTFIRLSKNGKTVFLRPSRPVHCISPSSNSTNGVLKKEH